MRLPDAPQASSPWWWLWGRFTDAHAAAYRLSRGRIGGSYMGAPVVLVDSIGRRSGRRRSHPLLCLEDGDDLVVVASKGGVDSHPAWYLNLRARPETTIKLARGAPRRPGEGGKRGGARAALAAGGQDVPQLRPLPGSDGTPDPPGHP